ncbi:MAG: branched-chain amino acid ABC transporter permease [Candidatus Methylacidiphilales bacterium]|nr:branched-chain amino acid ABC transporter permease [Candidatus Methylacidiphilales bacterium]
MKRWWQHPGVLGAAGLFLITFPFLWLKLRYDYNSGNVTTVWGGDAALRFFRDLAPVAGSVLAVCLLRYWTPARAVFSKGWEWTCACGHNRLFTPMLMLGLVAVAPWLGPKYLTMGVFAGLFMIQALGLNITVGMAGLLVLGYAGFYAFGAYAFAVGQILLPGLSWWMAAPVVFFLGGAIGWFVGLPCLRLRGDYLAIVTLGFAESFRELMRNLEITGGDKGISIDAASKIQPVGPASGPLVGYLLVLLVVALSAWMVRRIYHSAIGRAWVAIREDETAAACMGIPVVRMKLLAFALSAAFAALAGVLYAAFIGFVDPAACSFDQSVMVLAMVILGGLGSIPGSLLGAAILYLVPTLLRDQLPALSEYRLLLFGIIMVAMMLLRPQGLLGSSRRAHEIKGEA